MLSTLVLLFCQAATAGAGAAVIGPDDVLDVQVFQVPDLNRTVRVDQTGAITLPLIGLVKATGYTPVELEREIARLYERKYLNQASVSVFLRENKSRTVSVLGAVTQPGVYQISSPKPLAEIIAMAQGLANTPNSKAGNRILVTHGANTIEVPVLDLLRNTEDAQVSVHPGDQVRVLPAEIIYVVGDVIKPGSFPLETHEPVNIVQALALAGGPQRTAKMKDLVIFRRGASGETQEIPLQLDAKLRGSDSGRVLEPNDILFVPGSTSKRVFARLLDTGLATASGVVIWRGY